MLNAQIAPKRFYLRKYSDVWDSGWWIASKQSIEANGSVCCFKEIEYMKVEEHRMEMRILEDTIIRLKAKE